MALAEGAAVFLDRDGTLIREVHYLCRPEQVEILPGVAAALRSLHEYGFKLIVVTNQSAVGRGWLSESELGLIHDLLRAKLADEGVVLDGLYYCPHHPTEGQGQYRLACGCRKPKTGMVDQAIKDLRLNASASYLIGDQAIDMELAQHVGARGILIHDAAALAETDHSPVAVVAGLMQATQWIFSNEKQRASWE